MRAEIVEIKPLTPNVKSFLLRLDEHMDFIAGQFLLLKIGSVSRAYSIASAPPREGVAEYVELIIKKVPGGKLTTELFKLPVGSFVDVKGPFGKMVLTEKHGDIFLATGTGIAPFISMLRKLFRDHSPGPMYLFYGARNENEIIYRHELEGLAKIHKNFHLIISLSKPDESWDGDVGYVQDNLTKYIRNFSDKDAYICGLPVMVE